MMKKLVLWITAIAMLVVPAWALREPTPTWTLPTPGWTPTPTVTMTSEGSWLIIGGVVVVAIIIVLCVVLKNKKK